MSFFTSILLVALFGAIGGVLNSLLAGGFEHWHYDTAKKIWRPGWLGNVIIGAFAALVVWALYGPFSGYAVSTNEVFPLPVAQIGGCILVGISGAKILSSMADKQADAFTKKQLSDALQTAINQTNN